MNASKKEIPEKETKEYWPLEKVPEEIRKEIKEYPNRFTLEAICHHARLGVCQAKLFHGIGDYIYRRVSS